MSIQIENLSFAYDRELVLTDVSVQTQSGTMTTILGPNAAGKSTLLRCMIGALKPTSGRVILDGTPVHDLSPRDLATRIAYVPQRSIVSAAFTVRQVIELGRFALAPSSSRINEAIELFHLTEIANRRYQELSVGQQQRVMLARAVAQLEPTGHLILDEPTSGMDLNHAAMSSRLLRELAGRGASIVMAMHDLSTAASISDDIWLMDTGRLIAAGQTDNVMQLDRLESIFGVGFEWINSGGDKRRLLPEISV